MTICFNKIKEMVSSIVQQVLVNQNARVGLIKFRSRFDEWTTDVCSFTNKQVVFEQALNSHQPGGVSPDGGEAVGKKAIFNL